MAVKDTKGTDKLTLEIDNGDLSKLDQAMGKWGFNSYQSLLRFSISLLLLNEDNYFNLKIDKADRMIVPASDYLKDA